MHTLVASLAVTLAVLIPGTAGEAAAAPVTPYTVVTEAPLTVLVLLEDALEDAGPLPCDTLEVRVEGSQSSAWGYDGACEITFDTDAWDPEDLWLWAPWVVRHEVAHLMALVPGDPHGEAFRQAEAVLMDRLDISMVYGPEREYPSGAVVCGVYYPLG